ncbi:dipeptide ABC transporter ATP-binding protein [Leucobacter sp. GX24907]
MEVRDLSIGLTSRPDRLVVRDINFEIRAGEVLGLVGESGSGKTTTGLALLGHARTGLTIRSGSVVIDGQDILALKPSGLRAARGTVVAYVPQDPASALNPAMRMGEQIAECLRAHPAALRAGESVEGRVVELLEQVGLPAEKTIASYPHQMSGGQQQRVGIAIALAARPELVVFDEPTTGLDVSTQRQFLDLVRELTLGSGISAVYVSHDLPVVSEISDQTAVMYQGEIVEVQDTPAFFAGPKHPYSRKLLDAAPSFDRAPGAEGGEGPAPDTGDIVLACSSLRASHGSREVLTDINFELERGCCVAVVGESGSGKTTLARSLIGLHRTWDGEVEFDGHALERRSSRRTREQRRKFQYVFQSPYNSLNPRRTIADILNEPLQYFYDLNRSERHERIAAALTDMSLSESYLNRYPAQLSGGERQRVSLARALVVDPEVLLCDEVTSALDVSVQAAILEELRELQQRRDLSMLFITHNLAVVREIAQDVLVLRHGVIVENGSVDDVLDRPQDPYTRRLLADVPRIRTAG